MYLSQYNRTFILASFLCGLIFTKTSLDSSQQTILVLFKWRCHFCQFFLRLFMGKQLISILISVLPESMLKTDAASDLCFSAYPFPCIGRRPSMRTPWNNPYHLSSSLSPLMSSESMSEPRALAGRPGDVARAIENGGAVIHGLLSWLLRLPECLCAGWAGILPVSWVNVWALNQDWRFNIMGEIHVSGEIAGLLDPITL